MSTTPIIPEVLPPEPGNRANFEGARGTGGAPPADQGGSHFHPLSSLLLLGIDNLWNLEEWIVIDWPITIPLSFVTVFLPTLLVQRRLSRDPWNKAVKKALFFAVVAAIPTSITGTPVGLAFLAWAGFKKPSWRWFTGAR